MWGSPDGRNQGARSALAWRTHLISRLHSDDGGRMTVGEQGLQAKFQHSGAAGRTRAVSAALQWAWRHGLCRKPDFDHLRKIADDAASVAGGGPWQQAFDRLLVSLEDEAGLNPVGLTFAHVQLSRLLAQRRRASALWRKHPEIAQVSIARPIIVVGPMRSGTTRLQRLLGCDPRLNHARFFEVTNPSPGKIDWRLAESWAQLKLLDFLDPQLQAVHPTSPRAVEEVFGLLAFSFYGAQFEAQWRVPGFARYWEGEDRGWVYREFKQLLQTIAWQRGAAPLPWVLKAPQFMEDLEPLLAVFPDARLLCLRRDPGEIVTSSASLVWHQMRLQSDTVDQHWIGAEWLRKTALRDRLSAEVRAARPDVPQIDIEFAAVNADWRREMGRIYSFLEMELTPAVEQEMERYLGEAEASGFRHHRYRPADFGLEPEAIARALVSPARPLAAG
jgi:hypothetical protein